MNRQRHILFGRRLRLALCAALLLCWAASRAHAQGVEGPPPPDGAPVGRQGVVAGEEANPFRRLNLTPEQFARIREIRRESEQERRALLRRLAAARRALDLALYADDSQEPRVQQLARELAEAQSAVTLHRAGVEWRIRSVLTPTQLSALREMRVRAHLRRLADRRRRPGPQGPPPGSPDEQLAPDEADQDDDSDAPPLRRLPPRRRRGLLRRQP